jgi:NitT/TauT family transport system substrate-binding protein
MRKFAVLLATLAAATAAAQARAQQEEATFAVPALTITFTPLYVASEAGLWKKNGLDVKEVFIVGMGSTNAVLAGSADFAISSGPTLIRSNIRGQKLVAIAGFSEGMFFETVMRKEAAGNLTMAAPVEERAKLLKGKKIAVDGPNTVVHAVLRYFARKGGVDPERDIQVVPMQPEAVLAALKSGALDGSTFTYPWSVTAVRQGHVMISSPIGKDFPEMRPFLTSLTTTAGGFCDKKPSVCRKLVAGYKDALKFIDEKPNETLEILKKRLAGNDPQDLAAAFVEVRKWTPKSPALKEEGMVNAQELMLIGGMMKPEEKISSFAGFYDNRFAQ